MSAHVIFILQFILSLSVVVDVVARRHSRRRRCRHRSPQPNGTNVSWNKQIIQHKSRTNYNNA